MTIEKMIRYAVFCLLAFWIVVLGAGVAVLFKLVMEVLK